MTSNQASGGLKYEYYHLPAHQGDQFYLTRPIDGLPADGILMGGLNTILIAQGVRLIKKLIFAGDAIQQNPDN